MWTENFQMYKLGLEKAEEPKIKLPTFARIIDKAREFQKSICFIDYAKAFDFVDHKNLWKSLKEMGIPDHLTCLWKTYMQVKQRQLQPYMEQLTGSKLWKDYVMAVYCHPGYLTYAEYIMQNAGLDEAQAGIKIQFSWV